MLSPRSLSLLSLLQLASPALPVGAYSYSEGLEQLVDQETITDADSLRHWLEQELNYGAIRLEGAVVLRACTALLKKDQQQLEYWNHWLSAARETAELRQQSWQMGQALVRLLTQIQPQALNIRCKLPCNYAIAFALAAHYNQIEPQTAVLSYLQSWASNLITAGVKLIPLGQTIGQQLLLDLAPLICQSTQLILTLQDENLESCGWGLALASMAHEVQYTRLFRS